jgi:hypothetical protein
MASVENKMKNRMLMSLMLSLTIFSSVQSDMVTTSADAAVPKSSFSLLDLSSPNVENRFTPNSQEVLVGRSKDVSVPGVVVTIHPGTESFPGVNLKPEKGVWDLSQYGHFEARVVNTGAKTLKFGIRVDNANWMDSNCENYYI